MSEQQLFEVAESFSLTGLGVLLLPTAVVPELRQWALHTALKVQLRQPNGQRTTAVASVEEISRPHEPETRALLLTQEGAEPVLPRTQVWWNGQEASWEELF